jgi:hypothetical protein
MACQIGRSVCSHATVVLTSRAWHACPSGTMAGSARRPAVVRLSTMERTGRIATCELHRFGTPWLALRWHRIYPPIIRCRSRHHWLDDCLLVQSVRSDQHVRACPAITSISHAEGQKPSDRLVGASFVRTPRSRPQRNPVRFTSYAAPTRMRRSRSNVLHSAHESAYAAGQHHSLPSHTRKVGCVLRTGLARPHVRHAVRSFFIHRV